jgi:Zn finger protein HypA/HybF involved in hydrogenase expression
MLRQRGEKQRGRNRLLATMVFCLVVVSLGSGTPLGPPGPQENEGQPESFVCQHCKEEILLEAGDEDVCPECGATDPGGSAE